MGSMAYGCNEDDSDMDVYGVCIPYKEDVFPHLKGQIIGFGRQKECFGQYQEHHLKDPSARAGKGQSYDLTIYSIIKYFSLAMENNPNILDSLFVPRECITFSTHVWETIRENRRLFLHKKVFHTGRGYAFSQLALIKKGSVRPGRQDLHDKYGYDTKWAMHLCRICLEAEQILTTGDLDLRKDSRFLREIRNGAMTKQQVIDWFEQKEKAMEKLYHNSDAVPYSPDEEKLKQLLLNCLEHHYGSLDKCIELPDKYINAINLIKEIVAKL